MAKIAISKNDICQLINGSDLGVKALLLKDDNQIVIARGCFGLVFDLNKDLTELFPDHPELEAVVFEGLIKQYRSMINFKMPDAEYFKKHNKQEFSKDVLMISDCFCDGFWLGYDIISDDYLLTLEDYSVRAPLDIKFYLVKPVPFKGKEYEELDNFIKSTYYRGIIDLNFTLGD